MSGTVAAPIGITDPPIDQLLERADSKYSLVLYSAKRARQINAYYSQLNEGLLEYVGPLVETRPQEKPLSIAMREIDAGLLTSEATEELTRPTMRIVLGVSGGIAAYKAVLLLRLLREAGHDVRVVPTRAALEFVGRATWEALSGQPVTTDVFEDVDQVAHVAVGKQAELVIVAPGDGRPAGARGDGPGRRPADRHAAGRRACPVLLAPAMHTEMWEHPATVANVATLRARGVHVLDPAAGRLTGADTGPGRLPEPEDIAAAALALVADRRGTSPVGTSSSPRAAPASRWTPCASSATARRAGRASRWPRGRRPRRAGDARRREHRRPRAGRGRRGRGRDRRGAA